MVESKQCVLNDARCLNYKQQISKTLGGYEQAKAKGYFREPTNPAYKNYLLYAKERQSLKRQLVAVWDKIIQVGGKVEDRHFGSNKEMRRTLERLSFGGISGHLKLV